MEREEGGFALSRSDGNRRKEGRRLEGGDCKSLFALAGLAGVRDVCARNQVSREEGFRQPLCVYTRSPDAVRKPSPRCRSNWKERQDSLAGVSLFTSAIHGVFCSRPTNREPGCDWMSRRKASGSGWWAARDCSPPFLTTHSPMAAPLPGLLFFLPPVLTSSRLFCHGSCAFLL